MTSPSLVPYGYDNRTGRGPGLLTRGLGLVLPGVRHVGAQVEPYARAWAEHNHHALSTPGRRWVVLGDSMAQGVGASAWDAGWVDQLRGPTRRRTATRSSSSTSRPPGRAPPTSSSSRSRCCATCPPAVDTEATDLVTVLVGSNDLFAGGGHRDRLPDEFGRMVRALPRASVVATLPQPRAAARRANSHVQDAAGRGDLVMVDMRAEGPTSWRGRLAPDFFHPNDAGYAEMARAFEPYALRALTAG